MANKYTKEEAKKAAAALRKLLPPGRTIFTVLRHRSASGMQRTISLFTVAKGEIQSLDYYALRVLGERFDQKRGGLIVRGCGMDMGFHLAYNLSRAIRPKGHRCTGNKCNSNAHTNGMARDLYPRPFHSDSGYACPHRWL